jgi:hypothetical protein
MPKSWTLLLLYAYLLSCLKSSVCTPIESCIVNRRLPAFGLGIRRTQTKDMPRAFVSGSLNKGGVCHMGRLPLINNTLTAEQMPGIVYSAQMCTRSNTTLTCAMLSQNLSHPTDSTVHLHNFPVTVSAWRWCYINRKNTHTQSSVHILRARKSYQGADTIVADCAREVYWKTATQFRCAASHQYRASCRCPFASQSVRR